MDTVEAIEASLDDSHACFCGKLHLIASVSMFWSYVCHFLAKIDGIGIILKEMFSSTICTDLYPNERTQ